MTTGRFGGWPPSWRWPSRSRSHWSAAATARSMRPAASSRPASPTIPPSSAGSEEVCERILSVGPRRRRITIHGDYDVDGVSSTAILVSTLRSLGAECDWLIPDRLSDGYGLTMSSVEKLRRRGTALVITVDCGIGSVEEVAAARAAGIEVVVTDHHLPGEQLPDCPIVHPVVSEYPFEGLCAAGVAHKLATRSAKQPGRAVETVGGRRHPRDSDLDLVALATVADMVPLVGENRRLVREGLRVFRESPRVGLRALMAAASVDPETVDAGALGFRLAPRINAAGRLYRADAGVELMLTDDPDRANAIAAELDKANAERRWTEQKVVEGAAARPLRAARVAGRAPALVLAVRAGIPAWWASPPRGWSSVTSGPRSCSRWTATGQGIGPEHPRLRPGRRPRGRDRALIRYGGHRAAAAWSWRPPGRRFPRSVHRARRIRDRPRRPGPAGAPRRAGRRGPGGDRDGPGAPAREPRPLRDGKPGAAAARPLGPAAGGPAARRAGQALPVPAGERRGPAAGVAFGMNGEISRREDQALDLSVELEVDRWNGAEQPRVVVRELYPLESRRAGPEARHLRRSLPGPGR